MRAAFESLEHRRHLAATSLPRGGPAYTPPAVVAPTLHAASSDAAASVLTRFLEFGSPGAVGGYSFNQTSHSIDGAGIGIGGAADQFVFASAPTAQDFVISARLTVPGSGDTGIMIRNTGGSANAAMAALVVTSAGTLEFVTRASVGAGGTSIDMGPAPVMPYLRLARSGFFVTASFSADGINWTSAGPATRISFDSGASHAGIVLSSGSANSSSFATFTSVAIAGESSHWQHTDVGSPSGTGSVGYNAPAGTHTLLAGGSGIGGAADQVNFVSQPLAGDGAVVARVNSTDVSGEAGVMIRSDLSAGAAFAAVLRLANGSVRFTWRTTSGATASQVVNSDTALTSSVRLLRQGNFAAGYFSTNGGITWTKIGQSVQISLGSSAVAGLAATANAIDSSIVTATFTGVSIGAFASPDAGLLSPADEAFLDDLEFRTAAWFINTQSAMSGLFPDRASAQPGGSVGGNFSSMAATGFGLSALAIASSRGWIADGYDRALRTLNFLWTDADTANPANHGYYYHFVNQTTGQRSGTSELSSIDTALLISGVLTAGQYWKGTPIETLAQQIYDRVDWTFMQPGGAGTKLRMAWTPEGGFSSATWDSWSEGPLLYLLAMGSQTHPISASSWLSFARNQTQVTYAGRTFYAASGSPLFTNQYPQGWFDLRAKSDIADADPTANVVHLDPYQNSKNHTLAQRQALIDAAAGSNPKYDFYGPNAWGLTASDSRTGYQVFGGPPLTGNVDGTIVPTAPGGSLAFTPRESIDALVNLKNAYPTTYRAWGFIDAFNPRPGIDNWYDSDALGIDQGMILVAAENLRSGLVWNTFMANDEAERAVALAFTDNLSLVPPQLTASAFAFESGQSVSFSLSQDVAGTLTPADLSVVNLTTGATVPAGEYSLAMSSPGRPTTGTVTFFNVLADGNYELRIAAGGVLGSDGIANVADLVVPFRVLAGDANRDGAVNFSDLVILAQNYGKSGRTFSQGNFDYSNGGTVDFSDLVLLAQRYGQSLFASVSVTSPGDAPTASKSRGRPTEGILS